MTPNGWLDLLNQVSPCPVAGWLEYACVHHLLTGYLLDPRAFVKQRRQTEGSSFKPVLLSEPIAGGCLVRAIPGKTGCLISLLPFADGKTGPG